MLPTEALPEVLSKALKQKGQYIGILRTGFKIIFTGARLTSPGWILLENPHRLNRDLEKQPAALYLAGNSMEVRVADISSLSEMEAADAMV